MRCPECGSMNLAVTDSRNRPQRAYVYRVRKCLDCGKKFRTYETIIDGISDDYVRGYEQAKEDIIKIIKIIF